MYLHFLNVDAFFYLKLFYFEHIY